MLSAIPGVEQIEMRRCKERGFCCGAGGARMWLEENIGKRVNMERMDEALGTGADVVSTACPYCMIMLDDAVRANDKQDDVRVLDLSQLVEESLGQPAAAGAAGRHVLRRGPRAGADYGHGLMRRRRGVTAGLGALAMGALTRARWRPGRSSAWASGPPAGAASTSTLSHFLLKSDEQPGYTVSGHPTTMTTAAGLVEGGPFSAKQTKSIINTLKQAGFVKAVEESTKSTGSNEGFSLVMQFSSPAGAQSGAALFLHLAQTGQAGSKPFTDQRGERRQGRHRHRQRRRVGQRVLVGGGLRVRLGPLRRHGGLGQDRRRPLETGIRSQAKRVGTTCP